MSYKGFIFLICLGVILASCNTAEKEELPNIIFLLSDDQTNIATGCYGNTQVQTPNMDKLAEEGIMFLNHYNTSAICMASRVNIMTGMYEYKTGCNFEHGDLTVEKFENTYPVLLQKAGYFTGFAGKIGFELDVKESEKIQEKLPVGYFDMWGGGPGQTHYTTAKNPTIASYAEEYPHSTRAYGAWAGDFIKAAKESGKPFCMSISFKAPHLPFTPDAYFNHIYEGKEYQKPANYGAENATHLAPQAKTGRQYNSYKFWRKSEESYQDAIQSYNQLIHGVDYALGMIRKSLEEQGLADNTIIIFTSDNGYSCGAHNLGGKVLPYEEASKAPLIIFDPRVPKKERGVKRETVTANIDMAPTILRYAGLDIPDNMDGENLLPLIENEKEFEREDIALFNMWGNDEIQAMSVVNSEWKYIFWQYSDSLMQSTEELFNVGNDRLEMKGLASDPGSAEELEEMRTVYDKHYDQLVNNVVDYNNYEKYKVLFNRNASAEERKPFLKGTYAAELKKGKHKGYKIR